MLNGVTIAGSAVVAVTNNNFLWLQGVVTNAGTIELNSAGNATQLMIDPGLTLAGGGIVQIGDSANNGVFSAAGNTTFTIQNDTVEGAGAFGDGNMTLTLGANGTIDATGHNGLTINTSGNTVANGGLLEASGPGGLSVTSSAGVTNTGTIWADGDGVYVAGNVAGTGSERISGAATLRIGGTVAAGQTVTFDPGATGILRLDDTRQFSGTVSGLATTGANSIDLSDISFVNTKVTTAQFNNGVLTVTDGTHTATIALAGNYTGQTFVTSSDGHNGTTVIDPSPSTPDPFAAWTSTSAGGMGQINLSGSGSNLTLSGNAVIAGNAYGELSVLNGATFSATGLTVGDPNSGDDASGAVEVSGADSLVNLSGGSFVVGVGALGSFSVAQGAR